MEGCHSQTVRRRVIFQWKFPFFLIKPFQRIVVVFIMSSFLAWTWMTKAHMKRRGCILPASQYYFIEWCWSQFFKKDHLMMLMLRMPWFRFKWEGNIAWMRTIGKCIFINVNYSSGYVHAERRVKQSLHASLSIASKPSHKSTLVNDLPPLNVMALMDFTVEGILIFVNEWQ